MARYVPIFKPWQEPVADWNPSEKCRNLQASSVSFSVTLHSAHPPMIRDPCMVVRDGFYAPTRVHRIVDQEALIKNV